MRKKGVIFSLLILLLILSSCLGSQQLEQNEQVSDEKKDERTNIIVVDNFLLGEFDGLQYVNCEQLLAKGDWQKYTRNYDAYFTHQKDMKNVFGEADDSGYILVDRIKDDNSVALTCDWNPRVREVKISKEFNEEHKKVIQKRLEQNNLSNTPVVIKKIMQVDLDGDGVNEEIIEADNSEKQRINYEVKVIPDEAIEPNGSIKTFEQIGYYRIFVLMKGLNDITLWEDYTPISKEDFTFRTNEELGVETQSNYIGLDEEFIEIQDVCEPSDTLIYLYSQENEVKLYQPYEADIDNYSWTQDIVGILDINNDNNMEIILNYRAYPFGRIWIIKLEGNKTTTVLEREY